MGEEKYTRQTEQSQGICGAPSAEVLSIILVSEWAKLVGECCRVLCAISQIQTSYCCGLHTSLDLGGKALVRGERFVLRH